MGNNWGLFFSAAALICTLIGALIALSVKTGRIMQCLETLTKDVEKEKDKSHEKFTDLYKFKSDTEKMLVGIQSDTNSIKEMLIEMKADIKENRSQK